MPKKNKTLIIFRHGKPESSYNVELDHDRQLVEYGKEMSRRAGEFINPLVLPKVMVLCSTAARAVGTAKAAFNDKYNVKIDKELYLAPAQIVINKISAVPEENNTVIVVGHNPGLTETVLRLSNGRLDNLPMAGVCVIKYKIVSWTDIGKSKGEFIGFWHPGL